MRVPDQASACLPSGVICQELREAAESARPLIMGNKQTGRYAVSSFSHLYPAVNQNCLAELSSDINTSVFSILAWFQQAPFQCVDFCWELLWKNKDKELLKLKPKQEPKVLQVSPSCRAEFHPPDKGPPFFESRGCFVFYSIYFHSVTTGNIELIFRKTGLFKISCKYTQDLGQRQG